MFAQTIKLHVNHLGGTYSYNRAKNLWTFSLPKNNVTFSFTRDEIQEITEDQFLQKLNDLGVDISTVIRLENKNRKSPPTKYTTKGRGRPRKNPVLVQKNENNVQEVDYSDIEIKISEDCSILT